MKKGKSEREREREKKKKKKKKKKKRERERDHSPIGYRRSLYRVCGTEWEKDHLFQSRQSFHHLRQLLQVIMSLAVVTNCLHGKDHLRLDLREAIQHSLW